MKQKVNEADSSHLYRHYSFLAANYAMEPIRLYSWGVLRAFTSPSFDTLSKKTQNVFSEGIKSNKQPSNIEKFKEKISQTDFNSSNPFLKTRPQEIALRVFLGSVVIAIPMIGTGVIAIPILTRTIQVALCLGAVGQFFHASIASLSKTAYTVIGEKILSKEITTCTSIASWNIGLVSVFAPLNVGTWESVVSFYLMKKLLFAIGMNTPLSRIERQAEVIRKLNKDIICFQEFFDPLQAKTLYSEVRTQYPYAYLDVGAHFWKGPSGLGVFSKKPLSAFQVHDFKTEPQGFDKGTNKKFVTFDIMIQGNKVRLYSTHLNPGDHPKSRKSQLIEIKTHMETSMKEDINQCILLGDFNFDRKAKSSPDVTYFREHFLDHFSLNEHLYTCSSTLKFKHLGEKVIDFESIDYIATLKEGKSITAKNPKVHITKETLNLSDHLPITLEF